MAGLLQHLEAQGRGPDRDQEVEAMLNDLHGDRELMCQYLFPFVVQCDQFHRYLLGFMLQDLKITN